MSTTGIISGNPSSSASEETSGAPSTTSETSKLVPPMSTQIRLRRPSSRASATPPIVPPTGPESSVWSVSSRADSAVTMPPLDCITCSGTASPRVPSSDSSRSR